MWRIFRLAIKFFKRELYNGELSLFMLSLVIATGSLSCIGFLIERIDGSMNHHANQLNGAQLVLKSSSEVPALWLEKAQQLKLKQAKMLVFPSMLVVNDEFKLAQIKAVSANFPLQGELQVKKQDSVQITKAPPEGEIWLDKRLVLFFKLSFNQQSASTKKQWVELGDAQFKAGGLLERVPGQSNSLFTIAPTALINLADLDKTATIQPGSRVDYIYFFSDNTSGDRQTLADYQQWLKAKLQTGQSLRTGVEDFKAVNASLKKAADYLSLAGVLTLLLSAIAIAISSHRYGQKQYKNNAIMLCLGFSEKNILFIETAKLMTLGLIGSFAGIVLGYLVYLVLLHVLGDALTRTESHFFLMPVLVSMISGVFLLLTISMANLVRIKKLSPMGLIRNELLSNTSISEVVNNKLFYLISAAGLIVISIWYSGNTQLTLTFYTVLLLSAVFFYFFAKLLLVQIIYYGRRFQLINRLSLLNLERHKQAVLLQVTSFSLIFSLIILIFLVRTELLDNWQKQFPEGTPNHFVINVQTYERVSFESYLEQHSIKTQGLYPMIRGRLTHINHLAVNQAVPKEARSHNALHRALNLSVSDSLAAGKKSPVQLPENTPISIEKSLAKALNISLEDSLTFRVGSQSIEGRVTQIRQVKWDSFQPNFYIIFSPGIIEKYPMTWIASFYLGQDDKHQLNQLMAQFPGITIIEVDEVLKEIQFIINKVSAAIEVIFIFIVIAGALILSASLSSTMASRMYENAIIRTLGASTKQLRRCLLVEFVVVALLSALIAVLLAEFSTYILYQQVFQMAYSLHPIVWGAMVCVSLIIICGLGMLLVNKIFTQSAHQSLIQQME
ncbi:MAG: FtsX-like permease family protein [gamma proteobacterium symbiont of Lucinoma myriamae]|nr:FtsX-like permease family protein [gamma proteobacterium symbiont of Lucinoma myriamae]